MPSPACNSLPSIQVGPLSRKKLLDGSPWDEGGLRSDAQSRSIWLSHIDSYPESRGGHAFELPRRAGARQPIFSESTIAQSVYIDAVSIAVKD